MRRNMGESRFVVVLCFYYMKSKKEINGRHEKHEDKRISAQLNRVQLLKSLPETLLCCCFLLSDEVYMYEKLVIA